MKQVFLVFGYGVPKDIMKDDNYKVYLNLVFNTIFESAIQNNLEKPMILFCGGKTDMWKPYKRTEAGEMKRYFKTLCDRVEVKKVTRGWEIILEQKSVSTLENFLYAKETLLEREVPGANVTIFCEYTRVKRVTALAKRIMDGSYKAKVIGIDFDTSANRYLDPKFLEKKEQEGLKRELWALQNADNLQKLHDVHIERLEFLRKHGPKLHPEAVREWWQKKLEETYS